ncbi:unnamed protein product [Arctogadus glacialis]
MGNVLLTLSVNSMAVHAAAWTLARILCVGSLSAGLNRYERTCEDGRGQAVGCYLLFLHLPPVLCQFFIVGNASKRADLGGVNASITVSTLFTSSLQDVEGQGHGYCCCHHDPPTHTGTDNSILKGREGVGCLIQPLTPPVTRLAVNTLLLVSLPRSPPHPPGSPRTTPHHPTQRWIIPRRRTVTRHRLPLAPGPDSLYLKDPTLRPPPTPPDTPAFRSLTPPGSRHSCGLVWFRLAGTQSDFLLRLYPTEHSRGQGVKGLQFSQWKTTDTDTIMEVCAGGCLWGDKAPLQGGDTAGAGSANADPVARQCGSEVEESLGARKGC